MPSLIHFNHLEGQETSKGEKTRRYRGPKPEQNLQHSGGGDDDSGGATLYSIVARRPSSNVGGCANAGRRRACGEVGGMATC